MVPVFDRLRPFPHTLELGIKAATKEPNVLHRIVTAYSNCFPITTQKIVQ